MAGKIVVEPAIYDPLHTRVPFEYDALFYPHGYRARLRSNSALTLDAAKASWSTHRFQYDYHPLEIRLAVSASDSSPCIERPAFKFHGHLVSIVADRENFASIDLKAGFAFGWATLATARNQQYFRQYFLEAIVDSLLRVQHSVTQHSAVVGSNRNQPEGEFFPFLAPPP